MEEKLNCVYFKEIEMASDPKNNFYKHLDLDDEGWEALKLYKLIVKEIKKEE